MLVPVLLALFAVTVAIAVARRFFPATSIDIEHLRTDAIPTVTVYKGSTVIGQASTDHELFIASRVRVDNRLRTPIFLDDFHLTLTDRSGAELTVSGAEEKDLPDLGTNFAALRPLLGQPLLRNKTIDAGKSAEGVMVFTLSRVPLELWNLRKSAVVRVDVYHHTPLYVTVPK